MAVVPLNVAAVAASVYYTVALNSDGVYRVIGERDGSWAVL